MQRNSIFPFSYFRLWLLCTSINTFHTNTNRTTIMERDEQDSQNFCYSVMSKYPISQGNSSVGIVPLLFGFAYIFNAALTMYWITHQKFHAELGVERAARHVCSFLHIIIIFLHILRSYSQCISHSCGRRLFLISSLPFVSSLLKWIYMIIMTGQPRLLLHLHGPFQK